MTLHHPDSTMSINNQENSHDGEPHAKNSSVIPESTSPMSATVSSNSSTIPAVPLPRFLTPPQVIEKLKVDGVRKSKLTIDQTIILSIFAGMFKGIAGSISTIIGGNNPDLELRNPGCQQLIFAM